jgi:hypothetical protein
MLMGHSVCTNCRKTWTFDVKPKRSECFKCHLDGISLGFTYGKEDFHGPTIRERQQEMVAGAERTGTKIEPVGKRWV